MSILQILHKNIWFIEARRLFFIHMSNPPEIELYRCKKRRILRHNIFINISTLVSLSTGVKDFNIWQDVLYRVYIFEGYKLVLFILVKYLNATSILYDTAFSLMSGKCLNIVMHILRLFQIAWFFWDLLAKLQTFIPDKSQN